MFNLRIFLGVSLSFLLSSNFSIAKPNHASITAMIETLVQHGAVELVGSEERPIVSLKENLDLKWPTFELYLNNDLNFQTNGYKLYFKFASITAEEGATVRILSYGDRRFQGVAPGKVAKTTRVDKNGHGLAGLQGLDGYSGETPSTIRIEVAKELQGDWIIFNNGRNGGPGGPGGDGANGLNGKNGKNAKKKKVAGVFVGWEHGPKPGIPGGNAGLPGTGGQGGVGGNGGPIIFKLGQLEDDFSLVYQSLPGLGGPGSARLGEVGLPGKGGKNGTGGNGRKYNSKYARNGKVLTDSSHPEHKRYLQMKANPPVAKSGKLGKMGILKILSPSNELLDLDDFDVLEASEASKIQDSTFEEISSIPAPR